VLHNRGKLKQAYKMISVVILVTQNDRENVAVKIRETLQRRYNFDSDVESIAVHVRSGLVAPERLLTAKSKTLFVVLGPETAASSFLRAHCVYPVLVLSSFAADVEVSALQIAKFCALCYDSVAFAVERAMKEATEAALVQDAALKTAGYCNTIARCFDAQQQITGDKVVVASAERKRGKVRDRWEPVDASKHHKLALVTTDRQSGFDRQLAVVPYKGAVLNLCSQFWFDATKDIIPNHMLATPHPSVAIVRKCKPFPIEFVVRYVGIL
jgi:hypothetical protein